MSDQQISPMKAFDLIHAYHTNDLAIFVDEVGRGPVLGDVVACAVAIPKDFFLEGIRDSKKMTDKRRREVDALLKEHGIGYAIGRQDAAIIDEINILQATYRAMDEAIRTLQETLLLKQVPILVDGLPAKLSYPHEAFTKGDDRSFGIACASVLAKVYRDNLCQAWDGLYPGYGIAKHKGYGTKTHKEAVLKLGPTPIHRLSFISKWGVKVES